MVIIISGVVNGVMIEWILIVFVVMFVFKLVVNDIFVSMIGLYESFVN